MKKIVLLAVIVALMVSAVAILRIVKFSVVNDSKYPISWKMEYVSDNDGMLVPSGFIYEANLPPGDTRVYSVVKTPYYFEWWGGEGVCLKPAIGLIYTKDGLLLKPVVSTVIRFKQCWNMPGWYWHWLDKWDLEDWQNGYLY